MIRVILFCILLITCSFSHTLKVDESFVVDTTNTKTIEQIKNSKNFSDITKYNLGIIKENVWIKLSVTNNIASTISKRVYNKRAGLDFVDVYIFEGEKLLKSYKLGDMRKYEQRDNHFRVSYFDITLKPHTKIDIFIKQKTYGTMQIKWHLVGLKEFRSYYSKQTMVYFTILGFLLFTTLSSVMLYLIFKRISFIIYALFTICSIIYQLSVAGFMYEFYAPIYLNTFFNYTIPLLAVFLLAIFPISFFNLKNEYPYLMRSIKFLAFVLMLTAVLNSLYPLIDDILYSNKYTNIISILLTVFLFILSIRLYFTKIDGSMFYLVANSLLVVSVIYFILSMIGLIPSSILDYYSLAIGSIGQDLFLAFALAYSIYIFKQQNRQQKELVDEYSKLSFLGQTVINIYHQWKSPVNNIYNSITHIEVAKDFKDENLSSIIDENLEKIKLNTQYLKDTSRNYLEYYKGIDQPKTKFHLKGEIETILTLHQKEFDNLSLTYSVSCDNIELFMQKNILTNILIILVENVISVVKLREIKNPTLKILTTKDGDEITIKLIDNLGGIKEKNINDIFEKNHSVSSSTGLGLYLAKYFLLPKIGANIKVENLEDGACFEIQF